MVCPIGVCDVQAICQVLTGEGQDDASIGPLGHHKLMSLMRVSYHLAGSDNAANSLSDVLHFDMNSFSGLRLLCLSIDSKQTWRGTRL